MAGNPSAMNSTPADRPESASAPSPSGEPEGPRLGPYRLGRELGRGTMGRVHLAHEIETGQEVAIKTLALAREFSGFALREAYARFQREIQAAGRLRHPDIVRVIDSGETDGLAYIVMERLHGKDLSNHTQAQTLMPVSTVVAIGARVASALAHAHAHGVVHRDIKPANVMIDGPRNQVKVMDFGIARLHDASRTRTGLVLGSPSYMSPEQLAGRNVDGRSDLYSLGVLLFQLLTSRLPIVGTSMASLIHAIAHTNAPDARQLRPGLPEELANLVSILLEKRPELRYRDGLDVAADLRLIASMLQRRTDASSDQPMLSDAAPATAAAVDPAPQDAASVQEVAPAADPDVSHAAAMRAQSRP
ncbi:protein kinase domain-containing protein [Leptothrix cholodnii]